MSKHNWSEVTSEDVLHAIREFVSSTPEYPEPKSTYLVYEGRHFPAKHIRGMAYEYHFHQPISKNDFSGGMETVSFFRKLGFEVDYKGVSQLPKKQHQSNIIVASSSTHSHPKEPKAKAKIIIPASGVIEQKNALQLILNRLCSGDIVCEKTFPWLKTPDKIEGKYKSIYDALSAYRGNTTFAKKGVALRCDFVCESNRLIIEYDERQHFSDARRIALEAYSGVPLCFDKQLWIAACNSIHAKDNSPVNRDETRAYYDSARDIACAEHGYHLIRIMHGQIDFTSIDAEEKLSEIINKYIPEENSVEKTNIPERNVRSPLKVAMYLQTDSEKTPEAFQAVLPLLKTCKADIIVFPEFCYVPFIDCMVNSDICESKDMEQIQKLCLEFSRELGKAVVVCSCDKYDTIFSIFANAFAQKEETSIKFYIKHTMCRSSSLDFTNYQDIAFDLFNPAMLKGYLIGLTICYDCNHALFSRLYGMYGIDLIINSTGGNVIYDKWYKYNKARAIENDCYTLVTMGGNDEAAHGSYVYGFNKNGGPITPVVVKGIPDRNDTPGGIYIYEITQERGKAEPDRSNLNETINKNWHYTVPVGHINQVLCSLKKIDKSIYHQRVGENNVFFFIVQGMDILRPEIIQKLLYSPKLKAFNQKKYIIVNQHNTISEDDYANFLSLILKVRAMENFCAVILESQNINKCFQTGKNRTAQVLASSNGTFQIDLDRTSGPEAIWKNKQGMRESWRKNYEWLVFNAESLYQQEIRKSEFFF